MVTALKTDKKQIRHSMRNSFRGEIFFYFIVVFILFSVAIFTFQYQREKRYRVARLEIILDNITEITHRYIELNELIRTNETERIGELQQILPQTGIRITLIDTTGIVLYDSTVRQAEQMENHRLRPEIVKARQHQKGANIRTSETTREDYYYYAKKYPDYFIRTAIIYNVQIQDFLKAEKIFIFFILSLFFLIGLLLYLVTGKLSEAITKLKDFSLRAGKNEQIEPGTTFPDNELGVIGREIIRIYNNLKKAKDELSNEKEKLFNHLNALNEGIAFFSREKSKTLSNRQFIQYVNILSHKPIQNEEQIFEMEAFKPLKKFLKKSLKSATASSLPQLTYTLSAAEKYFKVQSIVFPDRSFEVMLTDITRLEKRRLMKQQLTSNIAHELKTPLASIKGYLETLIDNRTMPEDKQIYFLNKTYLQSDRLTELINDVSLLTNIEDSGELFSMKPVDIKRIIDDVYENFEHRIREKRIRFHCAVAPGTIITGNESLLYSIFQNFIENSINYGGEGIAITISNDREDDRYQYFTYADTGTGIPEEHLPRIFERFYRVDHGRSREMGGTGLGLSIVRNAIQLHKGDISGRNRSGGGIEFLFFLSKK